MSEEIELIKERLQIKEKQLQRQQKKAEEIKNTVENTEHEIQQLKYVLDKLYQMQKTHRQPKIIPNNSIFDFFKLINQMYEMLQHRLRVRFKYKLVCHVLFARYQFQSRSKTPGHEYLSFATVMAYFKRERGMVGA